MSGNTQNYCRLCLDVESEHVPILGDSTIHLHMKSCLAMSVSESDELPKEICVSCVSRLSVFYNFQLNVRCSLDWLESSLQEKSKKSTETKTPIQPLPDSEYNSDSLLEFLNNTANIEEYLNNLGKEDIPSIVSLLDRNQENSMDSVIKVTNATKSYKLPSPKKKEPTAKSKNTKMKIEIDVLDSEVDIVKEILMKETEPKKPNSKTDKNSGICFACKAKFDNIQKLSQHFSTCDLALRTCIHCDLLFDSRQKMQQHSIIHNALTCNCGKQFPSKDKLKQHHKVCHVDRGATLGCIHRCKQCSETFKERFQLYKHAKQHVLKMEERICDICGHKFVDNEALAKHRAEDHKLAEDLLYRCKICGHTSPEHKDIYLHVQKHIDRPVTERHLCETCGRSYTTRNALMRHVLQHGNSHKCNICQKIFTDVKKRDEHILQHIETTMCERCGQSVNSYNLEVHNCV